MRDKKKIIEVIYILTLFGIILQNYRIKKNYRYNDKNLFPTIYIHVHDTS